MSKSAASEQQINLARLPAREARDFALRPDAEARAALAQELGLRGLRKLSFVGRVAPLDARDWQLTARLGASVVQDCVVTLDPVTTRIDEDVTRTYLAEPPAPPEGDEAEMPEDDTVEALPEVLDLARVMAEALALAVPAFPRAEGVEIGALSAAPPGAEPLTEETVKPFAGLAGLRDKLAGKDDGEPEE